METKVVVMLLFSVVMGVIGQMFFKAGMAAIAKQSGAPQGLAVVMSLFHPVVFLGLSCYGLGTITYIAVLSKIPLSLAYPFISLTYPAVLLVGKTVFHENVNWVMWLGVALICSGVGLIGMGSQQSAQATSNVAAAAAALK